MKSPEERFWKYVDKRGEDECWEWIGSKSRGYGMLGVNYKLYRTNRFSYEIHKGKIPEGLQVLHHCDNPPCVNPKHLWLGTNTDNMRDKEEKNRGYYKSGENNKNAKLTWEKVEKIRKMYIKKPIEIANIFEVSRRTISGILKNESWKT